MREVLLLVSLAISFLLTVAVLPLWIRKTRQIGFLWEDMNKYAQDPEYEGLVVSQETYNNALNLNNNREEKGLDPLILIVIPLIKDKNNKKISSTAIRENL